MGADRSLPERSIASGFASCEITNLSVIRTDNLKVALKVALKVVLETATLEISYRGACDSTPIECSNV